MAENATGRRNLPISIVVIVIVAGLLAAGWVVWRSTHSTSTPVFTIEGSSPSEHQGGYRPPPTPRFVWAATDTWIRARAGGLSVNVHTKDNALAITAQAAVQRSIPQDARWLIIARGKLTPAMANSLGLSSAQVEQIRAVPVNAFLNIPLEPSETQQLQEAFSRYIAATDPEKPSADLKVGDTLAKLAPPILERAQRQVTTAYAGLRSTLSDAQWEGLRKLSLAAPTPATPAANPAN